MTAPLRACTACNAPLEGGVMFCPVCGAASPTEPANDADEAELLGLPARPSWAEMQGDLQRALGPGFEVRRLLGRGGFGEVWEAYDVRLARSVAVKVLRAELAASGAFRERFNREARAIAKLRHSGIVPIYHVGESQGLVYFIMPLVEGVTLKATLDQQGRLEPEEATRILAEASDALREAHRRGIVHRDLKPENVMLEGPERRVLLMDFGIAQTEDADRELTGAGLVLGSPEYMSPEQATGARQLDGRSDIYSLGVVGYRMLAGKLPFMAETAREILAQHVLTPPEPVANFAPLPLHLSYAVMRCLAKRPDERWQSVDELMTALAGDVPVPAEPWAKSPPSGARAVAQSWEGARGSVPSTGVAAMPAEAPGRRRWRTLAIGVPLAAVVVAGSVWGYRRWSDIRGWEVAGVAVVTSYQRTTDSLRSLADRFRRGVMTGSDYRVRAMAVQRAVETRIDTGYGPILDDLSAWPGTLRDTVEAALHSSWLASLPSAALTLQESAVAGCTMQRSDSVLQLRDGARGTNCWWSAEPDAGAGALGAPIEYALSFRANASLPADAGLGLAWCGEAARCRVLWVWLAGGRVEWSSHLSGGGLSARVLGERVSVAGGMHRLDVRIEGGRIRVRMDGRQVLASASGEESAWLTQPGDLRVVVQNTGIELLGSEALTVVGMRP
jgi:predicted Ser/Thr protein kinase